MGRKKRARRAAAAHSEVVVDEKDFLANVGKYNQMARQGKIIRVVSKGRPVMTMGMGKRTKAERERARRELKRLDDEIKSMEIPPHGSLDTSWLEGIDKKK
ncbi:MAG: hypothetical protein Q7S15_02720 [bacterium]|nr:hypothetical protein [bacterium]